MKTKTLLYLDDLAVGMKFTSSTLVVTEDEIIEFAKRYDPQPFHTDAVAARNSVFGGLVASGWHTAAMTMRLCVDSDLAPVGGMIGAGVEGLSWPRPVRAGDTLRVESEIVSVRVSQSRPTQGVVVVRATTFNQHNEPVQFFQPNLIVQRRPQ